MLPLTSRWASTKTNLVRGGRLFEGGRLLIFWACMQGGRLFEVGAYSNKYGRTRIIRVIRLVTRRSVTTILT